MTPNLNREHRCHRYQPTTYEVYKYCFFLLYLIWPNKGHSKTDTRRVYIQQLISTANHDMAQRVKKFIHFRFRWAWHCQMQLSNFILQINVSLIRVISFWQTMTTHWLSMVLTLISWLLINQYDPSNNTCNVSIIVTPSELQQWHILTIKSIQWLETFKYFILYDLYKWKWIVPMSLSMSHNNQRNKFNFRFDILQWFQQTQSPTALMGNGLGLQIKKSHREGEHCSFW